MTPLRRRARAGAHLPFHRLAAYTLMLAAILPVAFLGVLVLDQVGKATSRDAADRTNRALQTADVVVAQASRDLDDLVRSYTAWPAFGEMLARHNLEAIRNDVLSFLVERGSIAAGVVATDGGRVTAGDPALVSALLGQIGGAEGPTYAVSAT